MTNQTLETKLEMNTDKIPLYSVVKILNYEVIPRENKLSPEK